MGKLQLVLLMNYTWRVNKLVRDSMGFTEIAEFSSKSCLMKISTMWEGLPNSCKGVGDLEPQHTLPYQSPQKWPKGQHKYQVLKAITTDHLFHNSQKNYSYFH